MFPKEEATERTELIPILDRYNMIISVYTLYCCDLGSSACFKHDIQISNMALVRHTYRTVIDN